jgi:hypothetical protein
LAADRRQQRDLTFLTSVSAADSNVAQLYDHLHAVVVSLVDRARESGAVRPDITGTDVFLLICAPVHVVEYLSDPPSDLWRRYLAIIFDGLRPECAHPLPPLALIALDAADHPAARQRTSGIPFTFTKAEDSRSVVRARAVQQRSHGRS